MTTTPLQTRPRRRLRPVQVADVARLSRYLVSVTFTGEFDGFEIAAPTQHIKVLIPAPGAHQVELPSSGPDGPVWPAGTPRPAMRTYTPRRFDSRTGLLEVQFVVHGEGPASVWAERAEVGDRLAIGGPGGRLTLPLHPGPWVIAGDESAIPAIGTLLDALPSEASAEVFIETDTGAPGIRVSSNDSPNVHWLDRSGREPGRSLLDALTTAPITPDTSVWVACEATAVRRIKRALLESGRIEPAHLVTRGYWRAGEADHPDHDYGEDA